MHEEWAATTTSPPGDSMRAYRARRDETRRKVQEEYNFLGFISSGTYGRVYKVKSRDESDSRLYAIKKFKPDKEGEVATYTGISQSAIREIALNRELNHENIVALKEVMLEDKSIYMVFEYAEHDFLQVIHHHLQTLKAPIPQALLKSLIYQLLNGVLYLHSCHILHRDLKPANILITSNGIVKIGDLGLARLIYEPLQPLTSGDKVVVTIWYRAPELLLGARHYNKAIDIWAVGCVMAELASLRPIFKGEEAKLDAKKNVPFQKDQLMKIFEVRGTPDLPEWSGLRNMPEYSNMKRLERCKDRLFEWCQQRIRSKEAYELLRQLFAYDPDKRLTAREALEHKWFQEEPKPTKNAFLSMSPQQLPPQRRITHDEASASMQAGANAAAAPPHVQQQPLQANSARATTSTTSFASAGAMGLAVGSAGMTSGIGVGVGVGASSTVAYGTTAGGGNYGHGAVGIKRVGVGAPGASEGISANTRKKTRLG